MSQRISDLQEVSSLAGTELVEVSVPNGASPTGYVTRSASTSLFGGGGGLPYRFEFELQDALLESDNTFEVTFTKGQFASTAFRPNSGSDPTGDWSLAVAIMNFNAVAAFKYSEQPYEFSAFALLNSSVWVNKAGHALGSSDGDRLRWGTFQGVNDGMIYDMDASDPNGNEYTYTPIIAPVDVREEGNFDSGGTIIVRFSVISPYGGLNAPEGISIKGYADINMTFSNYYQPA